MAADATHLRECFLEHLAPASRAAFDQHPELGTWLANSCLEAVGARREFEVTDEAFVAHVASALPAACGLEQLATLRVADLYLALACASGDRRALLAFESEFGRDIDLAVARSGNASVGKDEFRQQLRNKLFVPRPGKAPKIADYGGRGDLRSWVRVTAMRMVVDLARRRAGDKEIAIEADLLSAIPAHQDDPELDYIQRLYKSEFKDALNDAFVALTPRERNLLRHQVLHGLNIDQVGALYRVHRTTAFRWIEKARKALLRETRKALVARLRVGSGEFHSIMRVVGNDLDVSVRRILVSDLEHE